MVPERLRITQAVAVEKAKQWGLYDIYVGILSRMVVEWGMLKSMLKPMINHPQPEMGWISIPNLVVCGINALPHYVTSQVLQLFHNHGILQMIHLIIQITFT